MEDLQQTLPEENRGMPLTQEQDERVWLDLTCGPSRYDYAYGMPHKTFREFSSEFEGLNSSNHDESMKKNLAMEKKIVELSSQAEESRARERRLNHSLRVLRLNSMHFLLQEGFSLVLVMSLSLLDLLNLNLLNIQCMVNKEI